MGWFGRAQRSIEDDGRDCVERGYLLIPAMVGMRDAAEWEALESTAGGAVEIGKRFGDVDLVAAALLFLGNALIRTQRVADGLALLDEAMVSVVAGELASPYITGLVYCGVIDTCGELYELQRSTEWTAALTRWCDEQPDMISFTGQCLVHRAEIMQLRGAWQEALAEARRAAERFARSTDRHAGASAQYRQGEIHRVLGDFDAAEQAYRNASQWGWEPQPGLAMLRLTQGRTDAAAASIKRVLDAANDRLDRVPLLPAYVEIMLAAGEGEAARAGCSELTETAQAIGGPVLPGLAAHARGSVELAEGRDAEAMATLQLACRRWQEIDAPYEHGRSRLLLALACRALGDEDSAAWELDVARAVFTELGATPELARLETLAGGVPAGQSHGLSNRELQVLRLVAAGKSNRAIAGALVLSERTVDRHVSNILHKLEVGSRAAATGYAYEHHLLL
jgi:ATP/maltotriose-dependent transcriptional regulator MalT